ncbi:MAG: DUF2285 domain-containing protein [Rhizobiales bacterium]|nr:DUF2285 domain-containing protein [Hyphomicrobiales bacterium]
MPEPEQHVFWSPLVDPAIVILTRLPDFLDARDVFPPVGTGGRRDSPEGSYDIVCGEANDAIEVLFLPEGRPDEPLAALIPLDAETPGRAEALIRYWRSRQGRPMPIDKRMTAQQRRRLRLMMQAADGRANSASYREIGTVLFGRERVASGPWKTSSLRDMVIGLVEGHRRRS